MKILRNSKRTVSHLGTLNTHRFAILMLYAAVSIGSVDNLLGQMYINGPSLLCSSDDYTVVNYPGCCATITWSTEGNVQLNTGQGSNPANFTVNGNGSGKVKADVYYCGQHNYLSLDIWAGPPILDYISAETGNYGYAGNSYSFALWPYYPNGNLEITWYTSPSAYVWYNEENYSMIYFENAGYYYISADATNSCGTSDLAYLENPEVWIIYQ
jgi:hypothetical protein